MVIVRLIIVRCNTINVHLPSALTLPGPMPFTLMGTTLDPNNTLDWLTEEPLPGIEL
jgi:hypothetical protein